MSSGRRFFFSPEKQRSAAHTTRPHSEARSRGSDCWPGRTKTPRNAPILRKQLSNFVAVTEEYLLYQWVGRFLEGGEAEVCLQKHPLWNRSRLSRELCGRWKWRRPDGQIKDMACRELLRKLEFRTLIKASPTPVSWSWPGFQQLNLVNVDRSPISCLLSDIKPVESCKCKGLCRCIRESLQLPR